MKQRTGSQVPNSKTHKKVKKSEKAVFIPKEDGEDNQEPKDRR